MGEYSLVKQLDALLLQYPGFHVLYHDEETLVEGRFELDVEVMGVAFYQTYDIRIVIPAEYPDYLPMLYELSGKIPDGFKHINSDGSCCMGVFGELYQDFCGDPTLLYFVRKMVTDYFASVEWYARFGNYPFGQRSHWAKGYFEYYKLYWDVNDERSATALLQTALVPGRYRGHRPCPCGSGLKSRNCHGQKILGIIRLPYKKAMIFECNEMIKDIRRKDAMRHGC